MPPKVTDKATSSKSSPPTPPLTIRTPTTARRLIPSLSNYRDSQAERALDSSSEESDSEDNSSSKAKDSVRRITPPLSKQTNPRIGIPSSSQKMATVNTDPTFSICGKFSGEKGQSLSRWLVKLEWELRGSKVDGRIPADQLLPAINLLLTGEAEAWIQANPALGRLLTEPTEENRILFLDALKDQFPEEGPQEKVSCEAEMAKLVQETKDLTEYYQIGVRVLRRLGIKDQSPTATTVGRRPETLLLEAIINKWIRGLTKTRTRTRLIEVSNELLTLQAAYHRALNVEEAEKELKKDKELREKDKEVLWLRKCMERSLDPNRVTEFRAAYARQVQGIEEEPEWEIPEGLLRGVEPAKPFKPKPENRRLEKLFIDPQPEGPEGQRSSNEFVNGTRQFRKDGPSPLCIECGKIGHISKICTGPALENWEKAILRDKVFGPPGMYTKPQRGKNPGQLEPSQAFQIEGIDGADIQSVAAGIAGLHLRDGYIPLEVNLGEGSRPNKRAGSQMRGAPQKRREIAEEDSYTLPAEPDLSKPAKKAKTGLALLKGFSDAEDPTFKPLSVREIFDSFKAEVNLTDLLQYSPFLVASLKKFMTRETTKRHRNTPEAKAVEGSFTTEEEAVMANCSLTMTADVNTRLLSQLKPEDKAFRIPAQIRVGSNIINLPRSVTQADQGSELNLVSEAFLKNYRIPKRPLADIGYHGMSMKTATKIESLLHFWAEIDIAVEGIWRKVPCFVTSSPKGAPVASNDLLLGIPWLFDVNAQMDIRRGILIVGDPDEGELRRKVQGPDLVFAEGIKILMIPSRLLSKGRESERELNGGKDEYEEEVYEDSSDEDEESDSSDKDF